MRRITTIFSIMTAAAALVLGASAPAAAFDLTGNWEGKWSCTQFANGLKGKSSKSDSTLAVTSLGNNTFGARIDGGIPYRGIEIPDAAKPDKGELAIAHCGTQDDLTISVLFSELGRWKVSTKGAKGTVSGLTVWSNDAHHVATCKYKYKRVDTTNPNVGFGCVM